MQAEALKDFIRDIPDYPKPGILFKDITPLLANAEAFHVAIEQMAKPFLGKGITKVAGAEARGFLFGTAIAQALGAGFIPVRKKGKLPWKTFSETYDLEYGTDTLEIHQDAIAKGETALLVDDLLATGGTIAAVHRLLTRQGANVIGCSFLIELGFLEGRKHLPSLELHSVIRY